MPHADRITSRFVRRLLPKRAKDAHKGDCGRVLMLCGSVGFTGAAALAAMSALRGGAGLVFLGVPAPIYPIVAGKLLEAIVFPLPAQDGMLCADAVPEILDRMVGADCMLVGPGLGRSDGVLAVVQAVLKHCRVPLVLDADGINAIHAHKDVLRESVCPTILTPHEGEFARLSDLLQTRDRQSAAETLAEDLRTICVLKGFQTVVTDGERTMINPTGNPGMATGGSGDVLAGLMSALAAQKISPFEAAAAAVWLHGRAGDLCAARLGQYGMLPSDMLDVLPRLMK